MTTSNNPPTVIIQGREVIAKEYKGDLYPVTYANRTQANKRAAQLGEGWTVYQFSRPFYVGKTMP